MNIEAQIALIAVDFSDSFFGVIFAFKGQLSSIFHNFFEFLASIRGQLNLELKDSRRTQDFLRKMLNSTFNRELKFCKRENMNL